MKQNIITEAAILDMECGYRPALTAASLITVMFRDGDYTYGEAIAVLSTLNMVGLISDNLAMLLKAAYYGAYGLEGR